MSGSLTICRVQVRKRDGTTEQRRAEAVRRDTFYVCRIPLSADEEVIKKCYEEGVLSALVLEGPDLQDVQVDILRERCQKPS